MSSETHFAIIIVCIGFQHCPDSNSSGDIHHLACLSSFVVCLLDEFFAGLQMNRQEKLLLDVKRGKKEKSSEGFLN
jgi:hypothetical protein